MAKLPLDKVRITFFNYLSENLYVWTQFDECYKCPYLKESLLVEKNSSAHKDFPSYYSLKYAITKGDISDSKTICTDTLSAQDQSFHKVIIDQTEACQFTTINSGRNNIWPLLISLIVLIVVAAVFYLCRFIYNRRKGTDGKNEELNVKISQRLNSLDAFRGITILLMIFVNWGAGEYHSLDHAEWDGLHFADFIFPAFIFIMGVTMAISLKNLVIKKDLPLLKIYWNVLKRSIKLFLVGLILNSHGNADFRWIRIPGVLQRFAVSYFFVACVHILSLHLNKDELYSRIAYMNDIIPYWPDWILAGVMLLLHFTITYAWKFDDLCPRGYTGPGGLFDGAAHPTCVGGAANKLDKLIFTENHVYRHFTGNELYDPENQFHLKHDPEGFLGCTTSIVLTIIGLQVGKIILTFSSSKQRFIRWSIWTLSLAVLTAILAGTGAIPINKNLWSFTFICATGSVSIFVFALFYLLIDHFKVWPCGHPFHYPGMNSILLYIGHDFTGGMMPFFYTFVNTSHWWPLTQNITGVILWLLISVYLAKKHFFLTL